MNQLNIKNTGNCKIWVNNEDKDSFLDKIAKKIPSRTKSDIHTLLFYDPYDANINWNVLEPFINRWGEVIINHMISDPIRGMKNAKDKLVTYEQTYKQDSEILKEYGSDIFKYQLRLEEIIKSIRTYHPDEYLITSFPFFTRTNGLLYEIVFLTYHQKGLEVFKECAWKTFDKASSNKRVENDKYQLTLDLGIEYEEEADIFHYEIEDIVKFLIKEHQGKKDLNVDQLFSPLKNHKIFPSTIYRKEIKKELKLRGIKMEKVNRKERWYFL